MRKFLLFLCCGIALCVNVLCAENVKKPPHKTTNIPIGQEITLNYLKSQPAGISRDFYIWLFLQQNISAKEAKEAYNLATRKNAQLFGLYYKKGDNKTLSRKTICQRMRTETLLKEDPKCIALALTTKRAESFDRETLKRLSTNVKPYNQKLSKDLQILASKDPFKTLITQDARTFAGFYFAISQSYRERLNFKIPQETFVRFINEHNKNFERALRHIIITPALERFNHSLAKMDPKEILKSIDAEVSFYLGLNAMRFGEKQKALEYFLHSKETSKHSFNRNRATFWAFLASNDGQYLESLSNSRVVDVYTLASLEMTNKEPKFNIAYDVQTHKKKAHWDIKNPFEWVKIRDSFKATKDKEVSKQLLLSVNNENTKPHYVWLNREAGVEYFLMPYQEVFATFSNDKKALLYALGRQESLFIPTAISTSYALGVMQLMPFNVRAIAKELNQENKVSYLDMFDPNINISYAEYFTRPLEREFSHPLFIAYAYNGGPGFTRRLLSKNYLFQKSNALDPWYSLEMIPYEESRVYGKKVIANYVIYQKKLGKNISLLELLNQTLMH